VTFTAIYSDPVYVNPPANTHYHPGSVFNTTTSDTDGNTAILPGHKPTHDLYGTLTINFTPSVVGATIMNPVSKFIADTDCLPVVGASLSSNLLTLFGEGLVYVSANGTPLQDFPSFEVTKEGVNTFDVSDLIAKLRAGSCYSLVNESSLGTNIPLEVNGVDMPDGQACL
jgi:hypothetical protein